MILSLQPLQSLSTAVLASHKLPDVGSTGTTLKERWDNFRDTKLGLPAVVLFGARSVWVDPPRNRRLRVDSVQSCLGYQPAKDELVHDDPDDPVHPAGPSGTKTKINLSFFDPGYSSWHSATIYVALDPKPYIEFSCGSSPFLFGKEHKGSGMIGVALFSLPVALLTFPLLLVENRWHRHVEQKHGMSRHSHALFKAIEDQLDPDTRSDLKTALQKMWTDDVRIRQKFSQNVTLDRAKELLGASKRREWHRGEGNVGISWFDRDGDRIAQGGIVTDPMYFEAGEDRFVRVFGDYEFFGSEAEELFKLGRFVEQSEEI